MLNGLPFTETISRQPSIREDLRNLAVINGSSETRFRFFSFTLLRASSPRLLLSNAFKCLNMLPACTPFKCWLWCLHWGRWIHYLKVLLWGMKQVFVIQDKVRQSYHRFTELECTVNLRHRLRQWPSSVSFNFYDSVVPGTDKIIFIPFPLSDV